MARQTITAERRVVTERRRVESVQFGCCPLCSTVSVWSDVGSVAMRLTAGRAEERRRKGTVLLVSRQCADACECVRWFEPTLVQRSYAAE